MIELNKDGLAASEGWMQHQSATFGLHWKNAKPIIEAYFDTIHDSDAPALDLAILEAAGYTEDDRDDSGLTHFAIAMTNLRLGIAQQERATAEAEAQAELEAEAFKLYRAYMAVHEPRNAIGGWHMLAEHTKEKWLAVARRAREMRAEK